MADRREDSGDTPLAPAVALAPAPASLVVPVVHTTVTVGHKPGRMD